MGIVGAVQTKGVVQRSRVVEPGSGSSAASHAVEDVVVVVVIVGDRERSAVPVDRPAPERLQMQLALKRAKGAAGVEPEDGLERRRVQALLLAK